MAHLDVIATPGPVPVRANRAAAGELLELTTRTTSSGVVVVAVRGEVDMATCSSLRERAAGHLRCTHHLVLDLSGVGFLCAAGITVLVALDEQAAAAGAGLCVVARTRQVRRPLDLAGVAGVLDLHGDVGGALVCSSAREAEAPVRLVGPRRPGDLG